MNIAEIPISEYRRMAREAMKGRFVYLCVIAAAVAAVSLGYFDAAELAPWVIAAMVVQEVLAMMLNYGQEHIFLRRFRGEDDGPGLLLQPRLLPKLLVLFLLRDAIPTVLLTVSNRLPVGSYQELARASGFQMAGSIANAVMLYNYGMAEYMLINDPSLSTFAAMRDSRRTLSGNRIRLFMLSLSFIGWMLLTRLPGILLIRLAPNLNGTVLALIELLWYAPLLAYVQMSQTAFFEVISGNRAVELPLDRDFGAELRDGQNPAQRPALGVGEIAAYEMLERNGFSRRRLEAEGELDDYLALGISPEQEALWRRDWLKVRLDGYKVDPDGMDDALQCAAEFSDVPTLRGAVTALREALDGGQVIEGAIARQTLALARTLTGGSFDAGAEWAGDLKRDIAALADALEVRLGRIDPNGPWRETVDEIRGVTG